MPNIYWVYLNRFDEDISKAPRLEIAESLIDENFSVTLLTGYRRIKYSPKIYRLKIRYLKSFNSKGLFKVSLHLAIFFWLLKNAVMNDIVILSPGDLWMSSFLKKIKRCKIHLDIRTLPVEVHNTKNRIGYFLYWALSLKLFHRQPDSYSFITDLLKKHVEQEFNMLFKDYVLWQSGVNVDHFAVVRDHPIMHDQPFILTYLGVITRNRGIDIVLQALAEIRNKHKHKIMFKIIGDGPFLSDLKTMSTNLGIRDRVIFKGYVPYESVPDHLKDAACYVCPLPERPEWNVSSPIKIFEYLACGKPVILTPIVAHKNIITNNPSFVWTQGERVSDFINAIEYAFENHEALLAKSIKAYELLRNNYDWKKQGSKFSMYLKNKYESDVYHSVSR